MKKNRESQEVQGKSPLTHGVEKNGTPPYKKKEKIERKRKEVLRAPYFMRIKVTEPK